VHDSEEDGREQDHWNANGDEVNQVHIDSRSHMLDTIDNLTEPTACSLLDGIGINVELTLAKVFPFQKASHSVPVQEGYIVVKPTYVWANVGHYPLPVPIDGGVGVLDRQSYRGGTRGSRLCSEDHDRKTENSKVCARTRDTRFIQVRAAKVASPTSCLGDQVWRPALGVGLRSGARLGTRPSFI
jgi:hypothetical protein